MSVDLLRPAACDDVLHLPPELLREILSILPAKSILRFRSVCKSWYSLVSCPNFISDHSVRNLNKNPNRLLLHLSNDDSKHNVCSFSSHDRSFMESREHDEIPESFLGIGTSIVGSCNGLICLMKFDFSSHHHLDVLFDFLIWNPTTRKIVELPSRTYYGYPFYFGFGFDSKTSDYKVLSCTYSKHDSPNKVFQIFDLRKGVWRDISPRHDPSLRYSTEGHSPHCYLDGVVHWRGDRILLSFNFSDECFREINLPDCAKLVHHEDSGFRTIKSMTFGGLVYVIVFSKWDKGNHVRMSKSCSVWVMKEYGVTESWTKVYDIDLRKARVLPRTSLIPYQFLLWENDEVLMVHEHPIYDAEAPHLRKQDLVLYNTGNQNSKCMLSFTRRIQSVWFYEESLVLMR